MTSKPDMILWLNDARGVYIPRDFALSFKDRGKSVNDVNDEDWKILEAGPDHECYWETWMDVLDNAVVTDEDGVKYRLHQDGDLWLVPEGMVWEWEEDNYKWPEEQDESTDQS